ncbi:MAG: hypothetical protein GKR89_32540 [Candidatus Latescibacteria bacterium]|nr:hypothetical protein [Candidatus Latescibacterota bacterium]
MNKFLDLFGLRRRREIRLSAEWFIDVQVKSTDRYVGFFSRDISPSGLRLHGRSSDDFSRLLDDNGRAGMRLRVPGSGSPLNLEAQLRWGTSEANGFLTGWLFTKIDSTSQKALRAYIDAHPQDHLKAD